MAISTQKLPNPYIGPRPFEHTAEDRARFFGRNQEAKQVISQILSHHVTIIYSQSGAGKTSLVNAQILPALEEEYEFQVLPSVRVRSVLSANQILTNVRNIYVYNVLQELQPDADLQTFALKSLAHFLKEVPPRFTTYAGNPSPRVLVIDQLEELFSLFREKFQDEQEDFFKQIDEAVKDDPLLRVVLVLREEYLAQLEPFARFISENIRARFRLERLRREAALLAVKGPIQNIGRYIDPEVAEKIVDNLLTMRVENIFGQTTEVKGEYIEPVQLQVVCQKLWSEGRLERRKEITQVQLGDVDKALEEFYTDSIRKAAKQTGVDEYDLRKWCEQSLITSSGTRSIVHRDAESIAGMSIKAVEILEDTHLIRPEWRSGARWYELTHDRLIKPIKDSNKAWLEQYEREKLKVVSEANKNIRNRYSKLKIILPVILGGTLILGFISGAYIHTGLNITACFTAYPPNPSGGNQVTLDGGCSGTDPNGLITSYSWKQLHGQKVQLYNTENQNLTFTAPDVKSPTNLTFQLTVTDNQNRRDLIVKDVVIS